MDIPKIKIKQLRTAQATIGVDEGAVLLKVTSHLETTPVKKLAKMKLARAAFGKKDIKLHHLLQWDQKYKKLGHTSPKA